jgi:hypothetical protein
VKRMILGAVALAAMGCGGETAPNEDLVPAAGSVRVGGQPAAGVRLLFTPVGSTTGTGGFGITDAEGKFELIHRSQKKGVVTGEYVVTFSRFRMPDGKPLPDGQSPFTSGARESIPTKWSDPTKKGSHNTVKVTGDGKSLDFGIPLK